jgi:activating signal cointegrator 1
MKALTLTQPWAQLVIEGVKHIETRSWSTSYRGRLAIHAAKGWDADARLFAAQVCGGLLPGWELPEDLPRGAVLGIVDLLDVLPAAFVGNKREQFLGDFAVGRFGWVFGAIEVFPNPVLARGALGLWEWERPGR